ECPSSQRPPVFREPFFSKLNSRIISRNFQPIVKISVAPKTTSKHQTALIHRIGHHNTNCPHARTARFVTRG
ncbi:MAG: hypothetical protein HOE48_04465, partial [Candidatus Latescibacteria bacterium]|nr:hypothetical protein [Candidatus Latescibacterota bacterium]